MNFTDEEVAYIFGALDFYQEGLWATLKTLDEKEDAVEYRQTKEELDALKKIMDKIQAK